MTKTYATLQRVAEQYDLAVQTLVETLLDLPYDTRAQFLLYFIRTTKQKPKELTHNFIDDIIHTATKMTSQIEN